jgi:allophanate hydrolase subunit 1
MTFEQLTTAEPTQDNINAMRNHLKKWSRIGIIDWLQGNDSNGIYTDELAKSEGYKPLTKNEAINLVIKNIYQIII